MNYEPRGGWPRIRGLRLINWYVIVTTRLEYLIWPSRRRRKVRRFLKWYGLFISWFQYEVLYRLLGNR